MAGPEAWRFLAGAPVVHLASTTPGGAPLFRTVNHVVVDGAVLFHGAPAGEKLEALGREAVVAAEEIVAPIPSYFIDPERACPATTLYRSVQLHGVLAAVEDRREKARALQALMEKYQPEGGHLPIAADHPLYARVLESLLVVRVAPGRLDGKTKLGQNRRPEEVQRLVESLWRRGAPGDARAVDLVCDANPQVPPPAFLQAPPGARLRCAVDPGHLDQAVALLEGAYWNTGVPRERIARGHRSASAWVGALDESGRLIATARAIGDGAKWAGIWDVMIAEGWRGRGLGEALIRLLLDHPSLRGAARVWLATRDAQPFYARFGFRDGKMLPERPYQASEMILAR